MPVLKRIFILIVALLLTGELAYLFSQTVINGTTVTTNAVYTVGATDSGNSLIISNGGELFVTNDVSGRSAIIGSNNAAHLNSVLVWGTDSSWTNQGNLFIGLDGRSNSLTLSNGAFVLNNEAQIGSGSPSSNNYVIVTGSDSIWSNRSDLFIGNSGSGNRLLISNGGIVYNQSATLSANSGSFSNFVIVDGDGSVWSNRGTLIIGNLRASNTVSITAGGKVFANAVTMGGGAVSTNNLLSLSGANSQFIVTNSGGTSLFEVRRGAVNQNGGTVMANRLLLTNPAVAGTGAVYNLNGGALITDGTTHSNGQNFVVGTNATFVARGGVHEFQNELRVGDSGWSNSMVISNGADVLNSVGYIGQGSNSSNNTVLVTGSGSIWSNRSELYVGNAGSGNSLVITNGGAVFNGLAYLGVNTPGRDNFVAVGGAGSIWSNRSSVYIGFNRGSNAVRVTDGGTVYANHVYLGNGGTATNNLLSVSGSGSLWTNLGDMHVGYGAAGNHMTISDGGDVINGVGYIGHDLASSNNVVSLSGAGSLWSNRSDLYVGLSGAGNQMVVSNGGRVENAAGQISGNISSSNNTVTVTGAGSAWSNRSDLILGLSGASNSLTISNGGRVDNTGGYLSWDESSSNNVVTVTGTDSLWSNLTDLNMGFSGAGNSLTISNGGRVDNDAGYVGRFSSSSNNAVIVTGAGSLWSNRSDLHVGYNGASNFMSIGNGAIVENAIGYMGFASSSSNNVVTVSGVGSLWSNRSNLYVGDAGRNNALIINDGGQAENHDGIIGDNASSINNNVTVIGAGSLWSNRNNLYLGDVGRSNALTISDGGQVQNNIGFIGFNLSTSSNIMTVMGAGSLWNNQDNSYVGYSGRNNALTIFDGGQVENDIGMIGFNDSASNNTVTVAGTGSLWSNRLSLRVGSSGRDNTLIVSNGGIVHTREMFVGLFSSSTNNLVTISGTGSQLIVTNSAGTGTYDIRRGTNVQNGGTVIANNLLVTNLVTGGTGSVYLLNGGALITDGTTFSNGQDFVVGTNATFVARSGIHEFQHDIQVGNSGWSNSMTISNGADVFNLDGYMGYASSSSNNVATVTGNGSVWSNLNSLSVGRSAEKNTLNISNGGAVFNVAGTVGSFSTSSNNTVIVSGLNSLWSNAGTLRMGNLGQSNLLVISNGGQVVNNSGNIGYFISASNNTVLVMDAGSRWNNRGILYVGRESQQNALTIDNGGQVLANSMIVGGDASSTNNLVTINGVGTELIVSNTYDIQRGTNVQNGGTVILGELLVTNPTTGGTGGVYLLNGGLLTSYSTTYSNGQDFVIGTNATLAVQLGLHEFQNGVRVGNNGGGNSFIATNGSIIRMDELIIGAQPDSLNNQVILSLTTWTNRFDVSMGNLGTLMISNAAQLQNTDAFIGGDSNLIIVTGSGSSWTNLDRLHIGNDGEENRLIVSNGGYVFSANARLGWNDDSSSNNHILITGSGSLWSNLYGISVGDFSQSNSLSIENGGQVFSQSGVIGNVLWASNNLVSISGAGSLLSIDDELLVGGYVEKNHLFVSDGGELRTAGLTIGLGEESTNNTVVLNDSSSLIIVTNSAGTGTYDIRRGTNVQNGGAVIANNLLVTNNAFFSETGSVYLLNGGTLITDRTTHSNGQNFLIGTNATFVARSGEHRFQGDIRVGDLGEGNTFIVTNGSQGRANSLLVGYDTTASNNLTILSGAGTTWTNNLGVVVGVYGMNNRLVVSNGAVLAGTSGTLGATAGSSSNSALIAGAGTIWTNTGRLLVGGVGGRSNLLEIVDGAFVASSNGVMASHSAATGNVVMVRGAGSVWSNATSLIVGEEGRHNLLMISNGGGVYSQTGTIGLNLPAETASNRVFVTGSGSFWSNTGTIIIGNSSWSNSLTINDGGFVMTDSMILGNNPAASRGNRLEIADTASQLIVTNGSGTGALNVRRGTVDQNGGTVIANNLLVTNPAVAGTGSVYNLNGGTLITDGTTHSNGQNFLLGTNATFVARSGTHQFENHFFIGSNGWGNTLVISNSSWVENQIGMIGYDVSSSNNAVYLTSAGSVWSNRSNIVLGVFGQENMLIVSNGAQMHNNQGFVGDNALSPSNSVLITGVGSVWSNRSHLYFGHDSQANDLTISNGGSVFSTNMLVGRFASSTNNLVTVDGVNSSLIVTNASGDSILEVRRGTLDIAGGQVFANTLLATNAASVIKGYGTITGDTVVSNGAVFDVDGALTNVGNVNFGTGVNVAALTDAVDVLRMESGIMTNQVDFTIEAGSLGEYAMDFDTASGFIADGGVITWNFNTAPVYGHFGGVRSATDIFSIYQDGFGNFTSGFQATGLESYQHLTSYYDGTLYYLTVIPEPSTYALLVLGAICAGLVLRRKKTVAVISK